LSFTTLRKSESFDENYWLWLPISLYVQNLMNQFSFKQLFLISFVKLECCYKLLQFKNVLQLTIELIICAPMSQHNGFRMLSIFNYTFSSQHLQISRKPHWKCVAIIKLLFFKSILYHTNTHISYCMVHTTWSLSCNYNNKFFLWQSLLLGQVLHNFDHLYMGFSKQHWGVYKLKTYPIN
jgi:hypothetical protein